MSFCSLVSSPHHKRPIRSYTHSLTHHLYYTCVLAQERLCLALVIVCLPFQVRLESLRCASDFEKSKKSVRPYVSGFRFSFPPYGPRFGRSVLYSTFSTFSFLSFLIVHHGNLAIASCTSQPLLYRPLQFIMPCIAYYQALHVLYVLIKCLSRGFFIWYARNRVGFVCLFLDS